MKKDREKPDKEIDTIGSYGLLSASSGKPERLGRDAGDGLKRPKHGRRNR